MNACVREASVHRGEGQCVAWARQRELGEAQG